MSEKNSNFQLRVKPNVSRIFWLLSLSILLVSFFAIILLQRWSVFIWGWSQIFGFIFVGLLLAMSTVMGFYFLKLSGIKGSAIVFGEKEWKDSLSLFFLGVRSLSDIKQVRVGRFFRLECLELQLSDYVLASKAHNLFCRIYIHMIGHRVFFPLALLEISRLDLESQFLHLESMIGDTLQSSGFETGNPKALNDSGKLNSSKSKNRSIFSQLQAEDAPKLPPKEVHPVFVEVSRRKANFKEKGLDRLLCELFSEHIRNLPEKDKSGGESLPPNLIYLRHRSEDNEYEEIEFSWMGRTIQMGLRTNLSDGNEALLSLAVEAEVKVSLKVRVEIGTLDPQELEKYLPGDWEEGLKELEKAFQNASKSLIEGSAEKTSVNPAPLQRDLEELKKNFGLKDD